jgi:hypothetical protein
MTPDDIRKYLRAVARPPGEPSLDVVREALAGMKGEAVAAGDQTLAKNIWCLEETLVIQVHYLQAFRHLVAAEFYAAWCELEKTESALANLERHDSDSWPEFRLDFIQAHTARWQSLFPYRRFFSPEFLQSEKLCSICQRPVVPQGFCGHRVGEIYNGEMCHRTVTKLDVMGISLVDKPVQKYSVLFLTDEKTGKQRDHYDYALVQYPIRALRAPFDGWDVEHTSRRQPHSRYAAVGRNEPCPCESGKKYKKCCLREAGVLRPHFEFTFDVQPPDDVVLQETFIE